MATVTIYPDPFEQTSESYEFSGSLGAFLFDKYSVRPEWQIFHGDVDITSNVPALSVPAYGAYEVRIYPGYQFFPAIINAIIAAVASYAIGAVLSGGPGALENQRTGSKNNSLTARTNVERPLQRIEDIYGQVRSYPTLLAVPYRKYVNNDEFEYAYMSIGRGYFDVTDVRDSDTLLSAISGAGASFYNPETSPNSGSPFLKIGTGPSEPVLNVKRSNSVDGGTLDAPNELRHKGDDIDFTAPSTIYQSGDTDFLDWLEVGESFYVLGIDPDPANRGTFTVAAVTSDTITTVETTLVTETNKSAEIKPSTAADKVWLGPFVMEDVETIWCNIVAPNGLIKQGEDKVTASVSGEIEVQEVDENDTPTGSSESITFNLSAKSQDAQRKTIEFTPSFSGRIQIRVRRTSNTDYGFEGTVVDEIKWQDLYGVKNVTEPHFGDITTVHTITKATDSALRVKDRKLNCLATRKIPDYSSGVASSTLYATKMIAPILCHMATDSRIGRRTLAEIDIDNLYATQAAIVAYFGHAEAAEFCFTFDKDNMTFEEIASTVAGACFCIAYRSGSVLRLFFEQKKSASMMLFNHRNKVADSEARTITFTPSKEYDGVEVSWRDPDNFDSDEIFSTNDAAINPKQIQGTGLRNKHQAFWRAWREQNKLVYARVRSEFMSTGEGRALIPGYRIDNVDNTRTQTTDGYVVAHDGTTMQLSQPTVFDSGTYYISLMGADGSVEIIPCSGIDDYNISLATIPAAAIYTVSDTGFEPTRYVITEDSKLSALPFIVESVEVQDLYSTQISSINYSDNYYSKDTETP
ncbi:MAG: hypothetical protein JKY45_09270 [Emcibacter sp.]|nr:hypothetical protein [Emcibacter sp.]